MDYQINDLCYSKYETFSAYYVISVEKIQSFIKILLDKTPHLSFVELENQLDLYISEKCYFNLLTHFGEDFNDKIKHNIKVARECGDFSYLDYLKRKFQLEDDLTQIDLSIWNYKTNKIKIKLKSVSSIHLSNPNNQFTVKTLLAEVLGISPDQSFKYKSEIIRLIHKYIYDNQLQDQNNKNVIIPDEHLTNILLPLNDEDDSYTYINLPQYVKHLIK